MQDSIFKIKSKNFEIKKILKFFTFFLLALIFILKTSCKKIDSYPESKIENDNPNDFFSLHLSDDTTINKIISSLKRKNANKNFVNEVTKKLGIPFWNKALLYTTKNNNSRYNNSRSLNDSNTLIGYIPIVQNSQIYVSGQLTVKVTTTDTTFGFIANTDYKKYGFEGNADSLLNGIKIFALFSRHEKNIFGYTKFNILDNRILKGLNGIIIDSSKQYMLQLEPDNLSNNRLRSFASIAPPMPSSSCIIVNNYVSAGFNVTYNQIGTTCVITSFGTGSDGTSEDGFPIANSGGGGSSGSSGSDSNNIGNGLLGWVHNGPPPIPLKINPCDTLNKYAQGADFQAMLTDLRNQVPSRKENIYIFNNTLIPSSASNPIHLTNGFDNQFQVYPQNENEFKNSWGWFHNHFADSDSASLIFSAGDLNLLAEQIVRDSAYFKVNYKHFMVGVVSDSNTQYIIMVEDLEKFASWANLFFKDEVMIMSAYNGAGLNQKSLPLSVAETEKRFLKVIQNAGLRLTRGSNDFKTWIGLKLDSIGNNVTSVDACAEMNLNL